MDEQMIERLKKQGQIKELKDYIKNSIYKIQSNIWEGFMSQDKFFKVMEKCDETEVFINNIRDVMKELQKLERDNH